jgi:hypothetical protein
MGKENGKEKKSTPQILSDILDFNVNIDAQLTSKANLMFGASTFVLLFSLNKALSNEFLKFDSLLKTSWIVLLIGSFIASLLSIMVVLPKLRIFSKKERIKEDVFYYKNIINFFSRKKYQAYLKKLPKNNKGINLAYSNQIYSLSKNILPYKFKMLKLSGWILILSIFTSMTLFLIFSFVKFIQ